MPHPQNTHREDQAAAELGTTEITRGVAQALVATFAITLLAVPTIDWAGQLRGVSTGNSNSTAPAATDILAAPAVALHGWSHTRGSIAHKTLAANDLVLEEFSRFEDSLQDNSILNTNLLGPTRSWLARLAGWGTDQVWIGRRGWLFYRPDLDYSVGPGFLDPNNLKRRRRQTDTASQQQDHPDPRPAILDFARQLALRNIQLVIIPTPTKAMVHPEYLSGRSATSNLHNRSWPEFLDSLNTPNTPNITLFDPLPLLVARYKLDHSDQFLATDTHWRPEAMDAVARTLAEHIQQQQIVTDDTPETDNLMWVRIATPVTARGELETLIRLDPDTSPFQPQTVTIQQVLTTQQQPWKPDPTARVLVLGDSFTNIYSHAPMGWGHSAGFAEQLAWHLDQPVDRIARNADGAHATRRQLAANLFRLKNTRVVVWQFAVRELTSGNWPLIPLNDNTTQSQPRERDSFQGTLLANSGTPTPGTVPYRDAVISLHAIDNHGHEIVIFTLGMKDNRLTPAARLKPGDTLTLSLVPWTTVQQTYGRLNRIELPDPDFRLVELPTYWAEPQ
jgi:alginate O-acetyltransferase complex protein AlgJ